MFEPELSLLDLGELEAIQIAHEIRANLLLIDERIGARAAREQGFTVTGTLGVLVEASQTGFPFLEEALDRLKNTNFRWTEKLVEETRQRARLRTNTL